MKPLEEMNIGEVMQTATFAEKLDKQKAKFKGIKELKPVCRELCDLDNETIKLLYEEVKKGTCKSLSAVQRGFVVALTDRALKQAIKEIKEQRENK